MIVAILRQGNTLIAQRSVTATATITDYSFVLTAEELALITDPSALTLELNSGLADERVYESRVELTGAVVTQIAQPRITEDDVYRVTEDGTTYRITEGLGEPVIDPTPPALQSLFFAVF